LALLLRESRAAVIIATHDVEFAAVRADRCAMLFDGEIVYTGKPREFFSGNKFYTTAAHKGLRHIDERIILAGDVLMKRWA
jgi:energy-coupling factor transport system ATP-binding protein